MDKKLSGWTDQSINQKYILGLIKELQEGLTNIKWPLKEMEEISSRLARNNNLLANPVKSKQIIVHTAGKLGWIIAALTAGIISLSFLLINTSNKLDQYKMNDLIWRYIKISNQSENLEYLHLVEESYLENPERMRALVEKEELRQKQLSESEINNLANRTPDTLNHANKMKKPRIKNDNK